MPLPPPPTAPRRFPGYHTWHFARDILTHVRRCVRVGDGLVRLRALFRDIVIVSRPDLAGELFTQREDDLIKSPALRVSKFLLGEGLLTSEGDFHHRQRKLVLPAFLHHRIAGYADVMARRAEDRCRGDAPPAWQSGAVLDVGDEMMRLTLEIAAETLLGADLSGEASALGEALSTSVEFFDRATTPYGWLLNYVPTPRTRRLFAARDRLDATIYRLIRERRAAGLPAEDEADDAPSDLLAMLLAARDEKTGERMDDEQVRDEALTLFLAGHETTAQALTWTWLLLARHPEVQERLAEEARDVLDGRRARFGDYDALPFARQVFSESMRLYPPSGTRPRRSGPSASQRARTKSARVLAFCPSRWGGAGASASASPGWRASWCWPRWPVAGGCARPPAIRRRCPSPVFSRASRCARRAPCGCAWKRGPDAPRVLPQPRLFLRRLQRGLLRVG